MADAPCNPVESLALDGAVARRLGSAYEPRPQQITMVEAVDRAMRERSSLLVEAGTGVGKSFAYLLPAISRIIEAKEKVVVATNTIALQEQLIDKDIPLLRSALPVEFSAVLVKGRGNYLSIRRLMLASRKQERLFADPAERRSLHDIEDWAYSTRDGTLATLPQLERASVWEKAQSDAGNCMGRSCPTYSKCFYQAARRRMLGGDLLICNHALFFADLALRRHGASILPEHDHVVIDEAHAAEDVACEHFGVSLASGRARRLLTTLVAKAGKRGFLPDLRVKADAVAALDQAIHAVFAAGDRFDALMSAAQRLAAERVGAARARSVDGVVAVRVREADEFLDVAGVESAHAVQAFRDLALRLRRLRESTISEEDGFELSAFAQRAGAIADDIETLAHHALPGCVHWIEADLSARGRFGRTALRATPVDVAPILREALFSADRSVTLTSATLAGAGGSFEHIARRLGAPLEDGRARTLLLDSPFDHAAQVKLLVDAAMPDPRTAGFTDALAQRVLSHSLATSGGAFALFTSDATMRAVADRVRDAMLDAGLTLLVQGADGPRSLMLERFRSVRGAVLFGLATFWQGVDVRGDALRNVIITRLPFDPPDRPIVEARNERIAEQGGDPFFDETLPRAVLRFKQGFGRLIRSSADAGRVVVLDPRLVTKGYGRAFFKALPAGVTPAILDAEDDSTPRQWSEP